MKRVGDPRRIAGSWVAAAVSNGLAIDGAFLHGSIVWARNTDPLTPASDVDVLLVPAPGTEVPTRDKIVVDGVALDVSTIDRAELEPPERALGAYHLAGSLRSPDSILYDSHGWLGAIQREVADHFDDPFWIEARCNHATHRSESNLEMKSVV